MRLLLAAALPAFVGALPQAAQSSFPSLFEITVELSFELPTLRPRSSCGSNQTLALTLVNGVLKDGLGRTGYIALNSQFQFDNPPQENALFTSGFSILPNSSLALDGSAVWYQCISGTFFNLYNTNWASQCSAILFNVIPCDSTYQFPEPATVGHTAVATVVETVVSGSITSTIETTVPIPLCQIPDGQVQAHITPCAEIQVPIITVSPPPPPGNSAPSIATGTPPTATGTPPTAISAPPAPGVTSSGVTNSPFSPVTPVTVPSLTTVGTPVTTATLPFSVTTTSPPTAPTAGAITFVPGSLFALAVGVAVTLLCI